MRIRHPPGRSGRLWLIEHLAVADRAADILRRKQHALRREDQRLAVLVERSTAAWVDVVREAETWQRRAMILGARQDLNATATAVGPAIAHVTWRTTMGVEFPADARSDLPPAQPTPGTLALADATDAYRRAVERAVEHAAVTTAASRIRAELSVTQHRLRAVRDRWIPALRTSLHELELRLDEQEREELTRSRLHGRNAGLVHRTQSST